MNVRKLLLLTFTICFSVPGWGAKPRAELCEVDLSPRSRALARLVELGLQHQALKSEDVEAIARSPELINPYDRYSQLTVNLSFKQKFNREFSLATADEKDWARSAILNSLAQRRENEKIVAAAREDTAQLLNPKFLRTLKVKGLEGKRSTYTLAWIDGRPVFVGRMTKADSNQTMTVLLDPFHSKVSQRARSVPTSDGFGNPNWGFEIFEKDGVSYAVDFKQNIYIDLKKMEDVTKTQFRARYRNSKFSVKKSALVQGDGFARIVGVGDIYKYAGQMIKIDLLNPRAQPEVLVEKVEANHRPPAVHYAGGKAFATYYTSKRIYIYDAHADKMLKPVTARMSNRDENHVQIFADNGQFYLAYLELEGTDSHYVLKVRDLKSGNTESMRYHFSPGVLEFRELDGVPHVYFFDEDRLLAIDLRGRTAESILVGNRNLSKAFSWKGREILAWADDKELKILDFATSSVASARILPGDVHQILTVEYKGQLYALAAVYRDFPVLLQLTDDGGGE